MTRKEFEVWSEGILARMEAAKKSADWPDPCQVAPFTDEMMELARELREKALSVE